MLYSWGDVVTRQQELLILRLWRDWCKVWPEQYGHSSLQVKAEGYDPVFDVIPSQAYKDFYLEVVCGHPLLKHLNVFEVVDTAFNQIRAPEATDTEVIDDHPLVVEVDVEPARAGRRADPRQAESA